MSSISSARKGRKQHDRNDDFLTVKTDCGDLIENWLQQHPIPEDDPEPEYSISVFQVGCDDWPDLLLDGYRVASGIMKRSPVSVYELKVETLASVIFSGFVRVPDDMPLPIDLLACPAASPEEVRDAIAASKELAAKADNEPAPTKSAAPAPTYRTLAREPGDSFLDFECGARTDTPIRVSPRWTVFAFHNPTSRVVGRVRASLDLSRFTGRSLDLKIFDALGGCLLDTTMHSDSVWLDQVRIPIGDTVIAFRAPNGAEGTGACNLPHSRLLEGELPERPLLDSLILEPQTDMPLGECAVPAFRFASR